MEFARYGNEGDRGPIARLAGVVKPRITPMSRSCAWAFIAVLWGVSCHRHAIVAREDRDPSITAWFRDTTPVTLAAEGRTFKVQNAAERQALQTIVGRERALWHAAKPRAYRFLVKGMCFCPSHPRWLLVEVRADRVTQMWDNTGKEVSERDWGNFNVDMLFENLAQSNNQLSEVQVAFDEQLHYPRFVRTSMIYPDGWSLMWIRALRPM
jgi:hypothetical protein